MRKSPQSVSVFLGQVHDLLGLGFGDVPREHADHAEASVVNLQHDLRRLGFRLVEEMHQDVDHELHRRVVVVVEDDVVGTRAPCGPLLLDGHVPVVIGVRIRASGSHAADWGILAMPASGVEAPDAEKLPEAVYFKRPPR